MTLINCGTEVEIKNTSIKGFISGITIRFSNVVYEVSYFYNGEQKSCWMYDIEFKETGPNSKKEVGFK